MYKEGLNEIRRRIASERLNSQEKIIINLCCQEECIKKGSLEVKNIIEEKLNNLNLLDKVRIKTTGCIGLCSSAPTAVFYPEGVFYEKIKKEDVEDLIKEHILEKRPLERLLHKKQKNLPHLHDIPFFNLQRPIALQNLGKINPEEIKDYIAEGGYSALESVLFKMQPNEVIELVKKSGLKSRYCPVGNQWQEVAKYNNTYKFVICNADSQDGTFILDKCILEADPHSIIEGMTICGYAIHSQKGYIYIKMEHRLTIERLKMAILQAKEIGVLGENILNSGFSFDIEVYECIGAFVCSVEPTALISVLEGRRPMPKADTKLIKLWEQPSCLHHPETFAYIPWIINKADYFRNSGTKDHTQTVVFTLSGRINNTGLLELTTDTTLKTIIYDIGGGIPEGRRFKAVQIGTPACLFLPENLSNIKLDFENLLDVDICIDIRSLVVLDTTYCIVDSLKSSVEFYLNQSCGKCTPCRVGLKVLYEMLVDITEGLSREGYLLLLEDLGKLLVETANCNLGKYAGSAVLSALHYFKDEYITHIKDRTCTARVCSNLLKFEVDEALCKMCGLCSRVCPRGAIIWEKKKKAYIDKEKCSKCKACIRTCRFLAIN